MDSNKYCIPQIIEKVYARLWNENKNKALSYLSSVPNLKFIRFLGGVNEDYFIPNVVENKVHLSAPSGFNDIFDCTIPLNAEFLDLFGEKHRDFMCRLEMSEHYEDISKLLWSIYRVGCFTTENNLRNLKMWYMYSDCYKGACLEYNAKDIIKAVKEQKYSFTPVIYQEMGHIPIDDKNLFDKALMYKLKYWEDEQEWRIFGNTKNDDFMLKPQAVYLGPRIPQKVENKIKSNLKDKKIHIYNMRFNYVTQSLDIQEG